MSTLTLIILLSVVTFILTKILSQPIAKLLIEGGAIRANYLNREIPLGMGLVIGFASFPAIFIYDIISQDGNNTYYVVLLALTMLVGFIDDLLGNHQVKGLRGHFLLLLKRKLTSGALKALVISVISLYFVFIISNNCWDVVLDFLILVLMTNSFNLLDVRPGRAIKIYLLFGLTMVIIFPSNTFLIFLLASVFAYAPWDLKAKGMLGDTGSNLLGISIGVAIIINLAIILKVITLLFLVYLHLYAERKSLTLFIERVYLLRFLDNLGR